MRSRILSDPVDSTPVLKKLLARLNICSKETVVRQYDHEVQGGSVIKPLSGVANDGPIGCRGAAAGA